MFFHLKIDLVVQTTSLNYFIILTISLIAYRNANTNNGHYFRDVLAQPQLW